ncbi:hypothetical protein [Halorussus litoreus]|uniref:hypothetical protein n=1 Tax=Halorussus litoreus TaxID=1710536 RepID=UPI000E23A711|nr:hypothetical protein [Halorussus litoreus]
MNWTALVDPLVRYSLLAAIVTITAAYLLVGSGLPLLLLAGAGLLLIALGAGEAGAAPASGFADAENGGEEGLTEGMEMVPGSGNHSLRAKLLFYGIGLVVWDVVGLAMLLG